MNSPSHPSDRRRFFMEVSFDGTDFLGWQSQAGGGSVQQLLEQKLAGLFGDTPIRIEGSGRTDAGVHAVGMGVTFSAPPSPYIPDDRIGDALNHLLPASVQVNKLRRAEPEFHARYSAKGKAYTYVIKRGATTPFDSRYCWHLKNFDALEAVREALTHLVGRHDFSAFTVRRSEIGEAVRTIFRTDLDECGDFVCITFVGDGFLYKMVRSVMGTVAKVGAGRLQPTEFKAILEGRNRADAEKTAPPQGLFLMKVFYADQEWRDFKLAALPFWRGNLNHHRQPIHPD